MGSAQMKQLQTPTLVQQVSFDKGAFSNFAKPLNMNLAKRQSGQQALNPQPQD
jgi:hypothetical protein